MISEALFIVANAIHTMEGEGKRMGFGLREVWI